MTDIQTAFEKQDIQAKIFTMRGMQVMMDRDLAELFGIETKVLNQAVKRNRERFPDDFMFELSKDEQHFLRSQTLTLENVDKRGAHAKYLGNANLQIPISILWIFSFGGILNIYLGTI